MSSSFFLLSSVFSNNLIAQADGLNNMSRHDPLATSVGDLLVYQLMDYQYGESPPSGWELKCAVTGGGGQGLLWHQEGTTAKRNFAALSGWAFTWQNRAEEDAFIGASLNLKDLCLTQLRLFEFPDWCLGLDWLTVMENCGLSNYWKLPT